ncbi:hypothetical protein [Microbacterium yannicii]|uniref:hypothetical protein n=1 Tax=Microbacterium yannicii TaxID=671622 RepID=UPI0003722057|nr:hypothetical protein [Microbacterium yannicii]
MSPPRNPSVAGAGSFGFADSTKSRAVSRRASRLVREWSSDAAATGVVAATGVSATAADGSAMVAGGSATGTGGSATATGGSATAAGGSGRAGGVTGTAVTSSELVVSTPSSTEPSGPTMSALTPSLPLAATRTSRPCC